MNADILTGALITNLIGEHAAPVWLGYLPAIEINMYFNGAAENCAAAD